CARRPPIPVTSESTGARLGSARAGWRQDDLTRRERWRLRHGQAHVRRIGMARPSRWLDPAPRVAAHRSRAGSRAGASTGFATTVASGWRSRAISVREGAEQIERGAVGDREAVAAVGAEPPGVGEAERAQRIGDAG